MAMKFKDQESKKKAEDDTLAYLNAPEKSKKQKKKKKVTSEDETDFASTVRNSQKLKASRMHPKNNSDRSLIYQNKPNS